MALLALHTADRGGEGCQPLEADVAAAIHTDAVLAAFQPVAPWEAALGAQVEVPTLEGRVTMKIPPGSKGGQKLRLAGKGLPKPGGGAGDLYAALDIVVPSTLTEQEKKLYEQLRETSRFDPRTRFNP